MGEGYIAHRAGPVLVRNAVLLRFSCTSTCLVTIEGDNCSQTNSGLGSNGRLSTMSNRRGVLLNLWESLLGLVFLEARVEAWLHTSQLNIEIECDYSVQLLYFSWQSEQKCSTWQEARMICDALQIAHSCLEQARNLIEADYYKMGYWVKRFACYVWTEIAGHSTCLNVHHGLIQHRKQVSMSLHCYENECRCIEFGKRCDRK